MPYSDAASWREALKQNSFLPEGFQTAVCRCAFSPVEQPQPGRQFINLALIRMPEASSSFAGVFTKNAFAGWPVILGRELLKAPLIQGLVVNNRIANVGVAGGYEDAVSIADCCARIFGDNAVYLPSSTGVIGWKLPVKSMKAALAELPRQLSSESLLPFAEAIMTTDAWPKLRAACCGEGRIVGCAKGAGMVEPNMATMLSFLLTDLDVEREAARRILSDVVDTTFNRISIDGETSTSDTVILLSSRRRPYPGDERFAQELYRICAALAEDVVRNGEGCAHVFRISICGAPTVERAVTLARAVANAPLTKTAIRGNDPNVGRILQALGAAAGRMNMPLNREQLVLEIGTRTVFKEGRFFLNSEKEKALSDYLKSTQMPLPMPAWPKHEKRVEIALNLNAGGASAAVIGSDLSEEYIKINADYRS